MQEVRSQVSAVVSGPDQIDTLLLLVVEKNFREGLREGAWLPPFSELSGGWQGADSLPALAATSYAASVVGMYRRRVRAVWL